MLAQCRGWLPDAVGGIYWFTPDDCYTSCFVPLYCGIDALPAAYQRGDYQQFSWDSAWWLFNFVSNQAYDRWSRIIPDVLTAQRHHEAAFVIRQVVVDKQAQSMSGDAEALAGLLAPHGVALVEGDPFTVPADLLFVGSRPGAVDHTVADGLGVRVVVPTARLAVTTKALAHARRRDVVVLPDFVTTAAPLVRDGDAAATIGALTSGSLKHPNGAVFGACERAEAFLATWLDELPFGRPILGRGGESGRCAVEVGEEAGHVPGDTAVVEDQHAVDLPDIAVGAGDGGFVAHDVAVLGEAVGGHQQAGAPGVEVFGQPDGDGRMSTVGAVEGDDLGVRGEQLEQGLDGAVFVTTHEPLEQQAAGGGGCEGGDGGGHGKNGSHGV